MAHYRLTDTVKSEDVKPGDTIEVAVEGKVYETYIDESGVQRFRPNTVLEYMFSHNTHGKPVSMSKPGEMHTQMLNLNTLAVAFQQGKFTKRDYCEIVMQGYSICGFCSLSAFGDWTIQNPLWGGKIERIQPEEDDEDGDEDQTAV